MGELFFDERVQWEQKNPITVCGCLQVGTSEYVAPVLDRATVTKILNGNMLIVGWEQIPIGRKLSHEYRQAWWCRVILEDQTTVVAPTWGFSVDEELSQSQRSTGHIGG